MRKRFPSKELIVAAFLLALNTGLVVYFLGSGSIAKASQAEYETHCSNEEDDDGDDFTDCDDPDCIGDPACTPDSETEVTGGCSNQTDDDLDGLTDCGDPDCIGDPACTAPAPALGPAGLGIGALVLLGIGAAGLLIRRREQK